MQQKTLRKVSESGEIFKQRDTETYVRRVLCTVVGEFINIMKTTFDFNFDSYQAFKPHGYIKREAVNLKSFLLVTCKLVTRKKLVNN